ncbi:Ketoisovalerate oxidoreductase subunit VorD [uncultured archaeon]|nr:Ketoisovalerate oxidoreductase subunit VorD [uncultured archaeon]
MPEKGVRIAVIDVNTCVGPTLKCGLVCVPICPEVRMGSEAIFIKDNGYAGINEDLCTGCGLCVKKCPTQAIKVIKLPKEPGDPFFRYGVNSFRLYDFTVPKEKAITGIIGRNGIGKSTLLGLLQGKLTPNLDGNASWEDFESQHSGTEVLDFLRKVREKRLKVSVKPQDLEAISKLTYSVRELFSTIPGFSDSLVNDFDLTEVLDRKLKVLSGGELQRVALAYALGREHDLLFVDEFTSFLDLKQRLNAITKLNAHDNSIVVVEHDLTILDYLAEQIVLLWGEPGAFGVLSKIKQVRNGINQYFQGYLKEENIRFRPYEIKINITNPGVFTGRDKISYSGFEVNHEDFNLKAEAGFLYFGEVIGILGENGIGKTTFAKKLSENNDFALKPQVLERTDSTVQDFFLNNKINLTMEVTEKLELARLLEKNMAELSGGELQRVWIAKTLLQECKARIFDEPSSFLDVEQRLETANLIKRISKSTGVPSFVIDHDFLFIDMCCDRLVVFQGTPAKNGLASTPLSMKDGMNEFLKNIGITFRRDKDTGRPRVNKIGSQMDSEQKQKNEYYYVD